MKTTTTPIEKSAVLRPVGLAARRDELLALRCMNAALTGLLSSNTAREDGFFYDNLHAEELCEQAETLGLEMFDRFKKWRTQERHIQRLRLNKKVTLK